MKKTKTELAKNFGINIVDKLTQMLSEELAKNIDKEILKSMGFETEINLRRKKSIEKIRGY